MRFSQQWTPCSSKERTLCFCLVCCLDHYSTLIVESARSSETSVGSYQYFGVIYYFFLSGFKLGSPSAQKIKVTRSSQPLVDFLSMFRSIVSAKFFWLLCWLTLRPWSFSRHVTPKRWLTYTEIYGAETQALHFSSNSCILVAHFGKGTEIRFRSW